MFHLLCYIHIRPGDIPFDIKWWSFLLFKWQQDHHALVYVFFPFVASTSLTLIGDWTFDALHLGEKVGIGERKRIQWWGVEKMEQRKGSLKGKPLCVCGEKQVDEYSNNSMKKWIPHKPIHIRVTILLLWREGRLFVKYQECAWFFEMPWVKIDPWQISITFTEVLSWLSMTQDFLPLMLSTISLALEDLGSKFSHPAWGRRIWIDLTGKREIACEGKWDEEIFRYSLKLMVPQIHLSWGTNKIIES